MYRSRRQDKEYSKRWLDRWQAFVMAIVSSYAACDLVQSFIYKQRIEIGSMCELMITSIVAVLIPYFVKAFFGKFFEEKNRVAEQGQADIEISDIENMDAPEGMG